MNALTHAAILKTGRYQGVRIDAGEAETARSLHRFMLRLRMCEEAWEFGRQQMQSGRYDLVIFDEINYVISYKMLDGERVAQALAQRPERVHVICTGRNAHPKLVEAADLVTVMREVKHPYTKGILAQRGIDY